MPIVGVVLMLGTPRGRTNSLAFAAAWACSIFIVGALAVFVSGGSEDLGGDYLDSGMIIWKVVLGVVLLAVGVRYWLKRPREGQTPEQPEWMAQVDHFTALKAAGLALALSVLNPKNLVLVIGAGGAIASAEIGDGEQLIALAIFTAVASIGIAVPIAALFLLGDRSAPLLARMKQWLTTNNATIMTVVCLVLGAYLIVEGLAFS